jgi:hypothetical protein
MNSTLTKSERLLLAAVDMDRRGLRPFSAEDLVVEAWRKYPDAFGLAGYPQYPDSNRIYAEIMGSKPLRGRGWIVKVQEKRYQLTEAGRLAAAGLDVLDHGGPAARADLNRGQTQLLSRLMSSRAVDKVRSGRTDNVVFSDACAFWGISPRSDAKTLAARLETVQGVVAAASQALDEGGAIRVGRGGAQANRDEIQLLSNTHDFLLRRYTSELDHIRSRTDERVRP